MARIVAPRVEALRRSRGLSQRALGEAAGTTRQAVAAIESGRMQPGVAIALALARALDTTVEALFGEPAAPPEARRIASATIGGRSVSHALERDHLAFEPGDAARKNAFVAGCELAAGLLSRHAATQALDVRALWLPMTNRESIAALARGDVHAALLHATSSLPAPLGPAEYDRFVIATTEEGWLVAPGNPLGIRRGADLARVRARIVNRPPGAQARTLLDAQLRRAGLAAAAVTGYERVVVGQADAARAVAQGFADAAIGAASAARAFGLDFVALKEERCTLFARRGLAHTPEVRALIDALQSRGFSRDLQAFGTYDVTRTGELIA